MEKNRLCAALQTIHLQLILKIIARMSNLDYCLLNYLAVFSAFLSNSM